MKALSKGLRFIIAGCLSLVLLYCGVGMVLGMVGGTVLPAFPFSWVDWLQRPNLPRLLDHVVNFLLTSMVAALFKDLWRERAPSRQARSSSAI